jgi:hypothetical protein
MNARALLALMASTGAAVADPAVYAFGGYNALTSSDKIVLSSGTRTAWTSLASGTGGEGVSACAANNSYAMFQGGNGTNDTTTQKVTWSGSTITAATAADYSRYYLTAFADTTYGFNYAGYNGSNQNTLDRYNFAANTWATKTAGGTAGRRRAGSYTSTNGYAYGTGVGATATDIYNYAGDSWSTGTTITSSTDSASAISSSTQAVVARGTATNTDKYSYAGNSWSAGTATSSSAGKWSMGSSTTKGYWALNSSTTTIYYQMSDDTTGAGTSLSTARDIWTPGCCDYPGGLN